MINNRMRLKGNFGVLLSSLCLLGAFTSGLFFSGFNKPIFAPSIILIAMAAAIALLPGFKKGWSFPAAPVAGLLLGFWGWLGLSLLWSHVPYVSMIFFMTLGALPLLFFAVVQNPRSDDFIHWGRIALLIPLTILSSWTVIQFFFLPEIAGERIHYPMLNPNNLAVVMMMGVFLVLPFFARQKIGVKIFSGTLICMLTFAIFTTQSRGGSVALVIGLVVFGAVCWRTVKEQRKSFGALLALLLIELTIYFLIITERLTVIGSTVHLFGGGNADVSTAVRFYTWKSGLNLFMAHPFFGTGLGTFYLTFPPYRAFQDISDGFFVHLDPLQFGIEMGFPAVLLFYAFGAAVLLRTIHAVQSASASQQQNLPWMISGFAGLLGLLLNAHIDYDLYMLTSEMLAAILLASWYRVSEDILETPRFNLTMDNAANRIFILPLLTILLVISPVWIARAGIGVYYDSLCGEALARGDFNAAAHYASLIQLTSPDSFERSYLMNGIWQARLLQGQFFTLAADERASLFEQAEKDFKAALDRNPYNVGVMNQLAMLYFTAYPRLDPDGMAHAQQSLEKAVTLDPVNFDVRMGLGKLYDIENRPLDAVHALEGGLQYNLTQFYAPPPYFLLLSQARAKLGDKQGANQAMVQANKRGQDSVNAMKARTITIDEWINGKLSELLDR